MAHNPILAEHTLGPLQSYTVESHTVGVLYLGQRFVRQMKAGDGPRLEERIGRGGAVVKVVDVKPHRFSWRVNLPSHEDRYFFNATINMEYKVADPARMIDDDIRDTEVVVARLLEPILRRQSREYALNQHIMAGTKLEDVIASYDLRGQTGLEPLAPPDVVITLSDSDHLHIKALEESLREMRAPRNAEHVDTLPTSNPAYNYQVQATVRYRVDQRKLDEMPSESPEACQQHLWPRIQRIMRRRSQDYTITQMPQAQLAVQDALEEILDERGIEGFGIKVEQVDAFLSLEPEVRARYAELAQIEHEREVEAARLAGLQETSQFYNELVRKGAWAALAVAASKGEITAEELYRRLSAQQKEQLEMQMRLLDKLRGDDALSEVEDQEASIKLLRQVVNNLTPTSNTTGPALTESRRSQGQLTPGLPEAGEE